jgi:hypothetical protein
MMFGALWIWQRWIAVLRPKLRRIAHASGFEPSMMNKRGTLKTRSCACETSLSLASHFPVMPASYIKRPSF